MKQNMTVSAITPLTQGEILLFARQSSESMYLGIKRLIDGRDAALTLLRKTRMVFYTPGMMCGDQLAVINEITALLKAQAGR